MKHKRVSYKVAKALKEAGYPQKLTSSFGWYNGELKVNESCYDLPLDLRQAECAAPTCFEAWWWLWKEKKISIEPSERINYIEATVWDNKDIHNPISLFDIGNIYKYQDLEDVINIAIEHLVNNNLIK